MTPLGQFVAEYEGKKIEVTGSPQFQCVDLTNKYLEVLWGLPPLKGNAVDMWDSYPKDKFRRIPKKGAEVPEPGDIIIWGKGLGPYGHIAICLSANPSYLTSLDQNFPVGYPVKQVNHPYQSVLGWLRPTMKTYQDLERDLEATNAALLDREATVKTLQQREKDLEADLAKTDALWKACEAAKGTPTVPQNVKDALEVIADWSKTL